MSRFLRHLMKVLKDQRGFADVTPAPDNWIATLPEETRKAIPEEYHKDPNVVKYKTADEFFKGHRSLVETVGKKGVILPGEKATTEEIEKFYTELGRPAKPEEYKFTPSDKLHPAVKADTQREAWFRGAAHKLGLTGKQADQLNAEYGSMLSQAYEAHEKATNDAKAAAQAEMTKEWGDKYQSKIDGIGAFLKRIGGETAIDDFGDFGGNPKVLRMLDKLAGSISEDTIAKITGNGGGNEGGDEVAAALKEIEETKANKAHPYWNENDGAKHDEAIARMKKLYEIAYPEKVAS